MKRFFLFSLVTALLLPFSAEAKKPARITVMSYNVQAGKRFPTENYARFIQQYRPDFVAVQELDYMTKRFEKADFLGDLAEMTGMYPVYSATMAYSDGQYGIGLLSRHPILSVQSLALPEPDGSYEPRRAVSAVAAVSKDLKVRVTSTHLDLPSDSIRLAQVTSLTRWLSADGLPSILCGDFNARPDTEAIRFMEENWQKLCDDRFTFPNTNPDRKIDYIFARGAGTWKVVKYERLVDVPLSDHCPIVVTLEYTEK